MRAAADFTLLYFIHMPLAADAIFAAPLRLR